MAVAAEPAELRLEPDLGEARELAAQGNVVPVRTRFVDDCETPVSAFLKLRAGEEPGAPCFLLESAEQGQVGRYSFVGIRRSILRWDDGALTEGDGPAVEAPDPYGAVAEHLAQYELAPVEGLPPFAGGAVGFFGYDLVRTVEPLGEPNPDPLGLPDMALMITDVLLVFDHLKHELTIMSCAFAGADGDIDAAYERAAATIADVRARLRGAVPVPEHPTVSEPPRFESNMEREEFEAAVSRIVEYVHAGDAFQIVPSQRLSARRAVDAFSVYRGLRSINPSPYMYFLNFGDYQIVGASPELLVLVEGDQVETPGPSPARCRAAQRGRGPRFAERLITDPKERAEHVMLVDLGRNDVGRVGDAGQREA